MTEQAELKTKPTPEQLRVVAELVRNRFLFVQTSFSFRNGKLVKTNNWTIRSQSVRNVSQIELPANFCPITAIALSDLDPDALPKL